MPIEPSYPKVLSALAKATVKYLVAGGVAMNLHGLQRATFDLDLIIFFGKEKYLMNSCLKRKRR